MSLKRLTALILMASLAVALLAWDLTRSKASKTVIPAKDEPDLNHETSLILQGTLIPMITIPIAVRELKLIAALNTEVQQGEVIGIAPVQIARAELERAQSQLADADSSMVQAEERLREANEELTNRRAQAGNMSSQEIVAETGELQVEASLRGGKHCFAQASRPSLITTRLPLRAPQQTPR